MRRRGCWGLDRAWRAAAGCGTVDGGKFGVGRTASGVQDQNDAARGLYAESGPCASLSR